MRLMKGACRIAQRLWIPDHGRPFWIFAQQAIREQLGPGGLLGTQDPGRPSTKGLQEVVILDRLAVSDILWNAASPSSPPCTSSTKGQLDQFSGWLNGFLADREDLVHKAVGWMLREAWKKDPAGEKTFLIRHYPQIPRTALRYAIENGRNQTSEVLKGRF